MIKNLKKVSQILIPSLLLLFFILPVFTGAQNPPGGGGASNIPGGGASNIPGGGASNIPTPTQSGPSIIQLQNPFKCPGGDNSTCTIQDFIRVIIEKIVMPIGGLVAVLMIMYAGFLYVTAGGDPGQIKKAHDALLYAVIGAAILLGAFVISQAIEGTINQLKNS